MTRSATVLGIALAAAYYDDAEPVNIGSGYEISIKNLAEMIAEEVGYSGSIRWVIPQD